MLLPSFFNSHSTFVLKKRERKLSEDHLKKLSQKAKELGYSVPESAQIAFEGSRSRSHKKLKQNDPIEAFLLSAEGKDPPYRIFVYSGFKNLPPGEQQMLIGHEFAHILLADQSDKKKPVEVEREIDRLASELLDDPLDAIRLQLRIVKRLLAAYEETSQPFLKSFWIAENLCGETHPKWSKRVGDAITFCRKHSVEIPDKLLQDAANTLRKLMPLEHQAKAYSRF